MNIYLSHIGIEGKHCLLAGIKLITHTTTIQCAQIKRNVRQTKNKNCVNCLETILNAHGIKMKI